VRRWTTATARTRAWRARARTPRSAAACRRQRRASGSRQRVRRRHRRAAHCHAGGRNPTSGISGRGVRIQRAPMAHRRPLYEGGRTAVGHAASGPGTGRCGGPGAVVEGSPPPAHSHLRRGQCLHRASLRCRLPPDPPLPCPCSSIRLYYPPHRPCVSSHASPPWWRRQDRLLHDHASPVFASSGVAPPPLRGRGRHMVEDTEESVLVAGEHDRARGGREALLLRLTRQLQECWVAEVRHQHRDSPLLRLHGAIQLPSLMLSQQGHNLQQTGASISVE
jgi:hypothetical protein